MAEVGAIVSIVSLIVTGAQLSNLLFDIGGSLGSAGWEVRTVGTEIALFCSVMRLLERTLDRAQDRRYSTGAIETTQEILSHCQKIFDELKSTMDGLQKKKSSSTDTSVDLLVRIKWTMKRPQVQMQRATLESCKITLHIMLTTIELARRLSVRKDPSTDIHAEIEQEERTTQSLFMAQKCAIEKVEMLEQDAEQPSEGDISAKRSSMEDILSLQNPPVLKDYMALSSKEDSHLKSHGSTATPIARQQRRTSRWLQALLPSDIPNYSSMETSEEVSVVSWKGKRMSHLLEKWTDQGQMLNQWHASDIEQHQTAADSPSCCQKTKVIVPLTGSLELLPATRYHDLESADRNYCEHSTSYRRSRRPRPLLLSKELPTPPDTPYTAQIPQTSPHQLVPQCFSALRPTPTTPQLATSPSHLALPSNSLLTPPSTPGTRQPPKTEQNSSINALEGFKNLHIGKEDTCEKILPIAVRKHKLTEDWRQYALYVSMDNQERRLGLQEKPLAIQLSREGKKVSFTLRKLEILGTSYDNWPDFI